MRDDQASGLRRLFARRLRPPVGVGGAQATPVALGVALALAELGTRVLVVDRTRGLVAAQLGAPVRFELADVLAGDLAFGDVLLHGPNGLLVLPAARGLDELALTCDPASGGWSGWLRGAMAQAGADADLMLVNGLPPEGSEAEVLVAIRPTKRAVTAAYAQVKALTTLRGVRTFGVVVERAPSESAARAAFAPLAATARRFLAAELAFRGHVPGDGATRQAAFLHLAHSLLPAPAAA
jgi:flagellar biosynthesis protein FlhG